MKILHTADLHLGQVIYQNYDRSDEHQHFFRQLEQWCRDEQPDALLVSGDVFDIQQPSATVKKAFTDYFVRLHQTCPQMAIVITAGNHDSASRIQADNAVWQLANAYLVGTPPAYNCLEAPDGWQYQYIIKLDTGYIVALPYMSGERQQTIQSILDKVAEDNTLNLPVVMMAHQAVTGVDVTGHDFEIGKLKTQNANTFGSGFVYLALGHIHKPQTIGHQDDCMAEDVDLSLTCRQVFGQRAACQLRRGLSAYGQSGRDRQPQRKGQHSASCASMNCAISMYLPPDGTSFTSAEEAIEAMKQFVSERERGYIRFRFDYKTNLPSNFSQMVYDALQPYHEEWRYNPKMLWTGQDEPAAGEGRTGLRGCRTTADDRPHAVYRAHQRPVSGIRLGRCAPGFRGSQG